MSQDLAQQIQRVAAHVPLRRLNDKQIEALEVGRRFASDVAARHIPKCKDTINKPKPPPKLRR